MGESGTGAVLDALNARVKLSAEIYGLRAMLNVHAPDLPAVVMGDFNDGPFADLMEAEFLIHNIVDELAGTMLYPRTYMQHAMEPDAFAEAATTSFPDPLRNGAITNELIDHILVSKAIWSDAVPFRVKPHSCIVEQAAFDHHDGEDALNRARGLRPGDPSAGVGGPRILGGSGKRPSVRMGELLRF
jgi:hypothetical protein